MNSLSLIENSAPDQNPKWLPPIGGLLAAGMVAWQVCRLALPFPVSWGGLLRSAAGRVLVVSITGAVGVWALATLRRAVGGANLPDLILRISDNALWLTPLAVLLYANSSLAIAIAVVFMVGAMRSLQSLQGFRPEALIVPSTLFVSSDAPRNGSGFRRQFLAVCAALGAQVAFLCCLAGYVFAAVVLVSASSAIWDSSLPLKPFRRKSLRATLLNATLAILVTSAAMVFIYRDQVAFGQLGIPSLNRIRRESRTQSGPETAGPVQPDRGSSSVEDAYEGIVLWPKERVVTKLVAPTGVFGRSWVNKSHISQPFVIPFNGVYWFFKKPDVRPPRSSREAHGSPEALDIVSTDQRHLSMEAHQNFATLIDVESCSRIQIAIRNADPYRGTVSLELILINTTLPGKPSQSLGEAMVQSARPRQVYGERAVAREVLNFDVPSTSSLRRFDEVMIVFKMESGRAELGAKVGIDRFVLVPRGS